MKKHIRELSTTLLCTDVEFVKPEPIHNHNFQGKGHRPGSARGWDAREFIAWDGEGTAVDEPVSVGESMYLWEDRNDVMTFNHSPQPQPYVLLGNSKTGHIKRQEGLSTIGCFEFILNTKQQYPNSIFVGFGFNYDVNQILKDVPEHHLWVLHGAERCPICKREHPGNETSYGGYKIAWLPHKSFYIRHISTKRSAKIYDTFGFFQTSFLETCENYLGEYDPDLQIIEKGKAQRNVFRWEELDEFIIPYNRMELRMLVRIMERLRTDFHSVGVDPSQWHGPGAIANKVFAIQDIPISRDVPEEVLDASQFAYAGGRFEQFRMGRYADTVYEYDIRSAYPAAATQLPNLSHGTWEHVERYEPGTFGVWRIDYHDTSEGADRRPQPLFCRSETGHISYPAAVHGWFWTPEADLVPDCVQEGYVFREYGARPFSFVEAMYEQRRILQKQRNVTQRPLKLILNSLYGKLAQTVGGSKKGPPRWHQLEYAGYITSYTRAQIYRAMMLNPDSIIAVETDAVFATTPLELSCSEHLGEWELTTFDEICYIQSGFYYAVTEGEVVARYRGMDYDRETKQPDGLPLGTVLDTLRGKGPKALLARTTRYTGLGLGLRTDAVWRSWQKKERIIKLNTNRMDGKRYHLIKECELCQAGISMYDQPHPMRIGGYSGKTYARSLPWRTVMGPETDLSMEEWLEMNDELQAFAEDMDKWQ